MAAWMCRLGRPNPSTADTLLIPLQLNLSNTRRLHWCAGPAGSIHHRPHIPRHTHNLPLCSASGYATDGCISVWRSFRGPCRQSPSTSDTMLSTPSAPPSPPLLCTPILHCPALGAVGVACSPLITPSGQLTLCAHGQWLHQCAAPARARRPRAPSAHPWQRLPGCLRPGCAPRPGAWPPAGHQSPLATLPFALCLPKRQPLVIETATFQKMIAYCQAALWHVAASQCSCFKDHSPSTPMHGPWIYSRCLAASLLRRP